MKHLWKSSRQLRTSASRFTKHRLIVGGVFAFSFVALLSSEAISESEGTSACSCRASVTYDSMLPASHPKNRCALKTKELNWRSWLAGKSGSGQFHYFDLFELLHRKHSKSLKKPSTNEIAPES